MDNKDIQTASLKPEDLFGSRELKPDGLPSFDYSAVVTLNADDGTEHIDTQEAERHLVFSQNLAYWNKDTNVLSVNNF